MNVSKRIFDYPPEVVYPFGNVTISDDLYNCNLYFKNAESYDIIKNPFNNAYISNNRIFIKGDNRDTTYDVAIQATNSLGSVVSIITVTEKSVFPVILREINSTDVLTDNKVSYKLSNYFRYVKIYSFYQNPYENAYVSTDGILYIQGDFRNTAYTIVILGSNSYGSAVMNINVTEDIYPPTILNKNVVFNLNDESDYTFNFHEYVSHVTEFKLITTPFDNISINNEQNKFVIKTANRNQLYEVTVLASSTNFMSKVSSSTWKFSVVEGIKPPSVIDEIPTLNLTNEVYELDLSKYFDIAVPNIEFEFDNPFSNISLVNLKLIISPNFRDTTYNVNVRCFNRNFIGRELSVSQTLTIVEHIKRPLLLNNASIGPLLLTNNTETIDIQSFFIGQDLFFTFDYPSYDNVKFNNGKITIEGGFRDESYTISVVANNRDHLLNTYVSSPLNINVIENIKPCTLKNNIETITLTNDRATIDVSEYFDGSNISFIIEDNPNDNALFLNNTLHILGNYRNKLYTVGILASNTNHRGEKYTARLAISVSELIQPPTTNTVSDYEYIEINDLHIVSFNIENSGIFSGRELSFTCNEPGIIESTFFNIEPKYRNKEYKITIVASNTDYLGNVKSASYVVTVSEGIKAPALIDNGLSRLGLLKVEDDVEYIVLNNYFSGASSYSLFVFDDMNSILSEEHHGITLNQDVVTIKGNFRNRLYNIVVYGIVYNYKGVKAQVSSSLILLERQQQPKVNFRADGYEIYLDDEEVKQIDLSKYVIGSSLIFEITSNAIYNEYINKNILFLKGNYRDISYSLTVECYNVDKLYTKKSVDIVFNIIESKLPPFVFNVADPLLFFSNSNDNKGVLGDKYGIVNREIQLDTGISFENRTGLCCVLKGNSCVVTINETIKLSTRFISFQNVNIITLPELNQVVVYNFDFDNRRIYYNVLNDFKNIKYIDYYFSISLINRITFSENNVQCFALYNRFVSKNEMIQCLVYTRLLNSLSPYADYFSSAVDYTFFVVKDSIVNIDILTMFVPESLELEINDDNLQSCVRIDETSMHLIIDGITDMDSLKVDSFVSIKSKSDNTDYVVNIYIKLPDVEQYNDFDTLNLFTTNNVYVYNLDEYFRFASDYVVLKTNLNAHVEIKERILTIGGSFLNDAYDVVLLSENSTSSITTTFHVYETVSPPSIINGGFESLGIELIYVNSFLVYQLTKYFLNASTCVIKNENENESSVIIGSDLLVNRLHLNKIYNLIITGSIENIHGTRYEIESTLRLYDLPEYFYLVYNECIYPFVQDDVLPNLNYSGRIINFGIEMPQNMYTDFKGPYIVLIDRDSGLSIKRMENGEIEFRDYIDFDKSFVWKIIYIEGSDKFNFASPDLKYLNVKDYKFVYDVAPYGFKLVNVSNPILFNNLVAWNTSVLYQSIELMYNFYKYFTLSKSNVWLNQVNFVSTNDEGSLNHTFLNTNNNQVVYDFRSFEGLDSSVVSIDRSLYNHVSTALNVSSGWTIETQIMLKYSIINTTLFSTSLGSMSISASNLRFGTTVLIPSTNLKLNTLYHIVITKNGLVKINGELGNSNAFTASSLNENITITNSSKNIKVYHLRIYNVNMSATNILPPLLISVPCTVGFSYDSATFPLKYESNGAYKGSNFTLIDGKKYYGEWVKITTQSPINLHHFEIDSYSNEIVLAGSFDGLVWTNIPCNAFYAHCHLLFKHYIIVILRAFNVQQRINSVSLFSSTDFTSYVPLIKLDLGDTGVISKDVTEYLLGNYFHNKCKFVVETDYELCSYVYDDKTTNLTINNLYNDFTYDINITAYNDFGRYITALTVIEDITPPSKKNGGLESRTIADLDTTYTFYLFDYFTDAYVFEIVNPIDNKIYIDTNDNLVVEKNYRNRLFNVTIKAIATNHRGEERFTISVLTVSESIKAPRTINGSLSSLGTRYLTDNTISLTLTTYFVDVTHGYDIRCDREFNATITNNTLSVTGNYRNALYTLEIIGKSYDYTGKLYIIESELVISETIRSPALSAVMFPVSQLLTVKTLYDLDLYFNHALSYSFMVKDSSGLLIGDHGVALVDRNLELIQNFRNKMYNVQVFGHSTDYLGNSYVINTIFRINETIKSVSGPGFPQDQELYLTNAVHVIDLNDYFDYAQYYEFTKTHASANVIIDRNELIITPNYRNVRYNIEVTGKTQDFLGTVTTKRSTLVVFEDIVPPIVKPAFNNGVTYLTLLTNEIVTFSLNDYVDNAIEFDIIHVRNEYNAILTDHGASILGYQLQIAPNYRNTIFNIYIEAITVNIKNQAIKTELVFVNLVEGPPLPVPISPYYITPLLTDNEFVIDLVSSSAPLFSSEIDEFEFDPVPSNSLYKLSNDTFTLSLTGSYQDIVSNVYLYARNASGRSISPLTFIVEEGPELPVIDITRDDVFVSQFSLCLNMSVYFRGKVDEYIVQTLPRYNVSELLINNNLLTLPSGDVSRVYSVNVYAKNASGISENFTIINVYQSENIITGLICLVHENQFYNNEYTNFENNTPTFITYSRNFKHNESSTQGYINNYSYNLALSIKWAGYFYTKNTDITDTNITDNYKFYICSDDSSYVWIDSLLTPIISIDGIHDVVEKYGSISLTKNRYYPIRIYYGNNSGDHVCKFAFSRQINIIARTTNFKDYTFWLKYKLFKVVYLGNSYLQILGSSIQKSMSTTSLCCFQIIEIPDYDSYLVINEVISGKSLCWYNDNTVRLVKYTNALKNQFAWKIILVDIVNGLYQFINKNGNFLNFDVNTLVLTTTAADFTLIDSGPVIKNGGLESMSPFSLRYDDTATIDLTSFAINSQTQFVLDSSSNLFASITNNILNINGSSLLNMYTVIQVNVGGLFTILRVKKIFPLPTLLPNKVFEDVIFTTNDTIKVLDLASYVVNASRYELLINRNNLYFDSINPRRLCIENSRTGTSYYVLVAAYSLNDDGKYSTFSMTVTDSPRILVDNSAPTIIKRFQKIPLADELKVVTLSEFFDNVASYIIRVYDQNNNTVNSTALNINNELVIQGAFRNKVYYIDVSAKNDNGTTSQTLTIEEQPRKPTIRYPFENVVLSNDSKTFVLSNYFNYATSYSFIETESIIEVQNSITITVDNNLVIQGKSLNMTYRIKVSAINISGYETQYIDVEEKPPMPTKLKPFIPLTISNNLVEYNLDLYFADTESYAVSVLNSSITPATIIKNKMFIQGNNRGITYTLEISATNKSGTSRLQLVVTETPPPPTEKKSFIDVTITNDLLVYDLNDYFNYGKYYSFVELDNIVNATTLVNNVLTIRGNYRNIRYRVGVTGSNDNKNGTLQLILNVTEKPPLPAIIDEIEDVLLSNNSKSFLLDNYFRDASSYSFEDVDNIDSMDIVNDILIIQGNYRNTEYTIEVTASNNSGDTVMYVTVKEDPPAPQPDALFPASLDIKGDLVTFTLSEYFKYASSYTCINLYASINVDNVLNIQGDYRGITYDVTVTAKNITGNYSQTIEITEYPPLPKITQSLSNIALRNNSMTWNLDSYFSGSESYTFNDPENATSINGANLLIQGNYRGKTYTVTIYANNITGKTPQNIVVTEDPPLPVFKKTFDKVELSNNSKSFVLSDYVSFATAYSFTEIDPRNEIINATSLNNITGILTIQGANRNKEYSILLTAINVTGNRDASIQVKELAALPSSKKGFGKITIGNTTKVFVLSEYFNDANTYSFVEVGVSGAASIINKELIIVGRYRNKEYTIRVIGTNTTGSFQQDLLVQEGYDVPTVIKLFPDLLLTDNLVTYNLTEYFANATAYSFSEVDYNNATINATTRIGTNLYVQGAYRNKKYRIDVTASNDTGPVTSIIYVEEKISGPVIIKSFADVLASNNILQYNLNDYFQYATGYECSFVTNPIDPSPIILTGSNLSILTNYRGITYDVKVIARNDTGSIYQVFTVEERISVPTKFRLFSSSITISNNVVTFILSEYFIGATHYSLSVVDANNNAINSAAITNNELLTIQGNYRNITYNVKVTAINTTGSEFQEFSVTESNPPPSKKKDFDNLTLGNNNELYNLNDYFNYADTYTIVVSVASCTLLNDVLNVQGAYRNISYIVAITARNDYGNHTLELNVTEKIAFPTTRNNGFISLGTIYLTPSLLTNDLIYLNKVLEDVTSTCSVDLSDFFVDFQSASFQVLVSSVVVSGSTYVTLNENIMTFYLSIIDEPFDVNITVYNTSNNVFNVTLNLLSGLV